MAGELCFVGRTCSGCGAEIGHGRYLSCMGGFWHPECFRCHSCNEPITDYEVWICFFKFISFEMFIAYVEHLSLLCFMITRFLILTVSCIHLFFLHQFSMSRNRPFHKLCYKEQHHPRCDVCQNFVRISSYPIWLFFLWKCSTKVHSYIPIFACSILKNH